MHVLSEKKLFIFDLDGDSLEEMAMHVLSEKKLFIFDLDGVIYRNSEPILEAIEVVKELETMGKKIAIFTNNSSKTREEFVQKLANMGLNLHEKQIFSSAYITAEYLGSNYQNGVAFVIGGTGITQALKEQGFLILNESSPELLTYPKIPMSIKCDIVVVGWDITVTYDKFKTALMFLANGAQFYATNDDPTYPVPGAFWPGAGANVAFLSTAFGHPPLKIFGKPHSEALIAVLKALQVTPNEAVMVGDRLSTDILGGNRLNITTVAVETGVDNKSDLINYPKEYHPSYFFSDLPEMLHFLKNQ